MEPAGRRLKGPALLLSLLLFLPPAFLFLSDELTASLSLALRYLGSTLVPALFPFLLLTQLLSDPSLFSCLLFFVRKPLLLCTLISLTGGYPAAAVLLGRLTAEKRCQAKEASLLLPLLTLPSPAFVISVVGKSLLQEKKLGLLLYAALLLGQLPALFWFLLRRDTWSKAADFPLSRPAPGLFPAALERTAASLVSVSLSLLGASCLLPVLRLLPLSPPAIALLHSLLEISGGTKLLAESGSSKLLFLLAFTLSFGGLSVFLQLAFLLKNSGISLLPHLLLRPLCGLCSLLFLRLLLFFFPLRLPVTAPVWRPVSNVSPLSTCLLFFLFGLLLALPSDPRRSAD